MKRSVKQRLVLSTFLRRWMQGMVLLLISMTTDFMVMISSAEEIKKNLYQAVFIIETHMSIGKHWSSNHFKWTDPDLFPQMAAGLFQVDSLWSSQMLLCHRSWGSMESEEISVVNAKQYHKSGKAQGENGWQVLWRWTAFKLAHCDWEKRKDWFTCRFQPGYTCRVLEHCSMTELCIFDLRAWRSGCISDPKWNLFLGVGFSKTNLSLRQWKASILWFFSSLISALCFTELHAKSAWTGFRYQKVSGGLDYVVSWLNFNLLVGSVFS